MSKCDPDIYKYGKTHGVFNLSKVGADKYCKLETERSDRRYDWHYSMGRVHILSLPKDWKPPVDWKAKYDELHEELEELRAELEGLNDE